MTIETEQVPDSPPAIDDLRQEIDRLDATILEAVKRRTEVSKVIGKARMASGGTRLVLAREREIVDRFRAALGPDGTQVALLLLRSGRGPL